MCFGKMDKDGGAFPSEYMVEYRWFDDHVPARMNRPFDVAKDPDRHIKFLVPKYAAHSGPEADAVIRGLYRDRMQSTYQVDYCQDPSKKSTVELDPLKADTLMATMIRILEPYEEQILPPVPTSRVVLGYCPMRRYFTGRTVYQDDYSKPAYDILKHDFDRGIVRLATKPRPKEHIDYRIPLCQVGKKHPEPTRIHIRPVAECLESKKPTLRITPNPACL